MGSPILWVGFNLFVLLALALDLGVFHRKAHKIKFGEAGTGMGSSGGWNFSQVMSSKKPSASTTCSFFW